MFRDQENIKDNSPKSLKDSFANDVLYPRTDSVFDSYPKINKLITALYLVTDIIEKNEPIRIKLRTIAVEIISDKTSFSRTIFKDKIYSILTLLDISSAIGLVSEMNFNILKNEFNILLQSLEHAPETKQINHTWLEDFLTTSTILPSASTAFVAEAPDPLTRERPITPVLRDENTSLLLKKQRREDILKAIRDNGGSATISEVKTRSGGSLSTYSEKTLQRELVAMVKDNILDKAGEKRWSKYSIKS